MADSEGWGRLERQSRIVPGNFFQQVAFFRIKRVQFVMRNSNKLRREW